MSTAAIAAPLPPPSLGWKHKPLKRLLVPVLVALLGAGLIVARIASAPTTRIDGGRAGHHFVPLPTSPAIESAWGIRFNNVLIEADRGIMELRYQVVDPAKSERIHSGAKGTSTPTDQLANMPTLVLESNGEKITPSSAMMHFEHFHFQKELLGSTYSLLYGNSGGLLHLGDKITIQMADGLKLQHIVVAD
jgi:hypothetical protein